MDIEGEYVIEAPRDAVWTALNDLDVLQSCIPGCQSMEAVSDSEFQCVVVSKIGPVKAKFKAKIELTNVDAPTSYTLSGKGEGGVAGFGQGSADVQLADVAEGTQLNYAARVTTGGKIAQVGSRLIASTTRKLADQFFSSFREQFSDAS